jgi:hypothetical protein
MRRSLISTAMAPHICPLDIAEAEYGSAPIVTDGDEGFPDTGVIADGYPVITIVEVFGFADTASDLETLFHSGNVSEI